MQEQSSQQREDAAAPAVPLSGPTLRAGVLARSRPAGRCRQPRLVQAGRFGHVRPLSVPGAWKFEITAHRDARGSFREWYLDAAFRSAAGHGLHLAQANCSVSSHGALRGIKYADVPPGQAKYVTCLAGAVLDVVVDLRVGSPTFGAWHMERLD